MVYLRRSVLAGQVTLNGFLNQLQPEGIIELKRGTINLFDNQFALTRNHDQIIEFKPTQGLFNPNINIQLQTLVFDSSRFERRQPIDSEIRDDIVTPPHPDRIDVQVTIEGTGNQLLASLSDTSIVACQLNQDNTITNAMSLRHTQAITKNASQLNPQALKELADCIHHNAEQGIQEKQWLINPAIELTSTPRRSKAEIVALLSNRAISKSV